MKVRNIRVAKTIGTKTIAGLLALGLALGTPLSVCAEDTGVTVQEESETLQAKKVDGSEELTDISDKVLEMIQNEEVKLNEETKYLEDVKTSQKVDPETGDRVDEIPTSEPEPTPTPEPEPEPTPTPNPDDQDKEQTDSKEDQDSEDTDAEQKEEKNDTAQKVTESEQEIQAVQEADLQDPNAAKSNEELISRQQIVKAPEIVYNFRFWTVSRKYAFAKSKMMIREEIPEEIDRSADTSEEALKADLKSAKKDALLTNESVRNVGKIEKRGLLYILKEEENGWLYVESGNVRGFVKASEVYTGKAAQKLLNVYQKRAKKTAKKSGQEYIGIEGTAKTAEALVSAKENQAYTYLRATVNQTVVDKKYALANEENVQILEEKNAEARVIGTMNTGNLCYILADEDSDWIYVESGDVRGFVESKYLEKGDEVTKQVESAGEDIYTLAEEVTKPEDNQALYYTLTSTQAGTPGGEIRNSMIEYASQFVGNPYVCGGTSLTDGADCSGFVQQIYKAYGYNLPRVAADQSQYGTQIQIEDAQPGDLIFYAKDGYVYHVAMYAGDGKTIEAANEKQGIIYGTVNEADAVWATRILEDNYTLAGGSIGEVNATEEMYGQNLGNFTITYYCACEICCNKTDGITATGAPVVEGRTIAVDPSVIPYGTQVIIGGHVFTAEDCGGAIRKNHIDVYVNSHAEALALGVTSANVYLVKNDVK